MTPREKQFLVSMLEESYQSQSYTSFSATVFDISNQFSLSDQEIFHVLKRQHNIQPTGRISRVVGKQVYTYCEQNSVDVVDAVAEVAQSVSLQANEISDDLLCRTL